MWEAQRAMYPNWAQISRKVGRTDGGNDFSNILQIIYRHIDKNVNL